MKQTEGIIYLSEKRFRLPLANITKIEEVEIFDIFLNPEEEYQMQKQANELFILIPFVGDILCSASLVDEKECKIIADNQIYLKNPYIDYPINCVVIRKVFEYEIAQNIFLNIQENHNQLIEISASASIGQFEGRVEGVYSLKHTKKLIAFVLNGAFELQNRLLNPRDAVLLWNFEVLEFEALSNDAVILLLEI